MQWAYLHIACIVSHTTNHLHAEFAFSLLYPLQDGGSHELCSMVNTSCVHDVDQKGVYKQNEGISEGMRKHLSGCGSQHRALIACKRGPTINANRNLATLEELRCTLFRFCVHLVKQIRRDLNRK